MLTAIELQEQQLHQVRLGERQVRTTALAVSPGARTRS
jgi:hypothetical protein